MFLKSMTLSVALLMGVCAMAQAPEAVAAAAQQVEALLKRLF